MNNLNESTLLDAKGELDELVNSIQKVYFGKPELIKDLVCALVAGGHILIEDLPGTGKTLLAKTAAKVIKGESKRIQFTPDLLPSDILGVSVYDPNNMQFEFKKGPIFANIILADEINRASAKTQSALLECMQEKQITVDSATYKLPETFTVIATQNPIESSGTYDLPEAQVDRFIMKMHIGELDSESQKDVLKNFEEILESEVNQISLKTLENIRLLAKQVFISDEILNYLIDIHSKIKSNPNVKFPPTIRGLISIIRISRVLAIFDSRNFVVPDDVKACIYKCLNHRVILKQSDPKIVAEVITNAINSTEIPK